MNKNIAIVVLMFVLYFVVVFAIFGLPKLIKRHEMYYNPNKEEHKS